AGKMTGWQKFGSDKLDLTSRTQAAPAVLDALKTNEADFAELRAASRRPYSRYPIDYNVPCPADILLPHLNHLRGYCRHLQLKACAELTLGRSQEALDDVKLAFAVADSIKGEPFLISYLVRLDCLQITTQPIWEGLAEHAWSDAQLQELGTKLQEYDFIADLKPAFDGEQAWGIGIIDFAKQTGKLAELSDNGGGPGADVLARLMPSGWYYFERVNYCRLLALQVAAAYDTADK